MQNSLPKKTRFIYRIIGIGGCLLVFVSFAMFIFGKRNLATSTFDYIFSIIFYLFVISCFILIIIKPERLEFLSLVSFLYCILMLYSHPSNIFSVIMFSIGLITLQIRGFFRKKKILKLSVLGSLFILCLCSELRFGFSVFINSFLDILASSFLMVVIFIFVQRYIKLITPYKLIPVCNFSDYDELTEQDKEIIRLLKEGQKYDWIAGHLGMATPTLKKKVRKIFEILDVPDLTGFHAKFSAKDMIFTKEEFIEWKKNNLFN